MVGVGVLVDGAGDVVVAGADGELRDGHKFYSETESVDALEPMVGLMIEFDVFVIPIVPSVVPSVAVALLTGGVVGVFVFGSYGKCALPSEVEGVAEA